MPKISQLPPLSPIAITDEIALRRGNKTYKGTVQDIVSSFGIGIIGKIIGANFNSIVDQSVILSGNGKIKFAITDIIFTNPSITLSVAKDGQLWTGANRTGINSMQVAGPGPFGLAAGEYQAQSNGYVSVNNKIVPAQNYFSLGVPQGALATGDIYIIGIPVG